MNINLLILVLFLNMALSQKHHPYIKFERNYNPKKMPLKSLPLDVNLTINIKNIYGINEIDQLLGMETTVQMNWIDNRITLLDIPEEHLNLDRITLPPKVCILFVSYCSKWRYLHRFYNKHFVLKPIIKTDSSGGKAFLGSRCIHRRGKAY